jgi:DNA-binding Xre family transcriptional regulator
MLYFMPSIADILNYIIMSTHIRTLINQLVSTAKTRGLPQAKLAEMAGMTAVGLSKAKGRGDIRASTLAELGAQLDLELVFIPRRSREKATEAIKTGAFFRTAEAGSDNRKK